LRDVKKSLIFGAPFGKTLLNFHGDLLAGKTRVSVEMIA